jgi:type III secretion protein L
VLRAQDHARLTSAAEVADAIDAERERVLAEAQAQADALLADAQTQADALIAQAQTQFDGAWQQGFDQGMQDAAAHWAAQQLQAAEARRRSLVRQSERLSGIVSMAVERVIEQEDRSALFRRSLRTITRLVKDAPMLTLRVPEADRDSAQRAVDEALAQAGTALSIEVVTDPQMPEGACRFESDGGVIDAGLDTQLAAIRRAVERAARQMAQEDVGEGDDADAADDAADGAGVEADTEADTPHLEAA